MDFIGWRNADFLRAEDDEVLISLTRYCLKLRMSGDSNVFRNKASERTVADPIGGSVPVAQAVPLATMIVGDAVVIGRGAGFRAERSSVRGHRVSPMTTALVLAAAIALSPVAINQTKVVRECVWNFHVFLCRWRTVDTPPARKGNAPTTADSLPVNWAARTASHEISMSAPGRM
jgi:hypothetical protein